MPNWERIVGLIAKMHLLKDNEKALKAFVVLHFPEFRNKSSLINKEWLHEFETQMLIELEETAATSKSYKLQELLVELDEIISSTYE